MPTTMEDKVEGKFFKTEREAVSPANHDPIEKTKGARHIEKLH